ncbi:MAG: hypothetical protein JWM88_3084 [Verrucomicrobia bacterium]|nr:hypothetical protein [Verrucomicrobiota bacterium]
MNILGRWRGACLFSAGSLLFAGCASTTSSRVDANRAAYESWPFEVQQAVLSNKVLVGMTPEMVQTSLGKPTEVVSRSSNSGEDEIWVYRKGGSGPDLGSSSVSMGGGIGVGGVSVGGSTSGTPRSSSKEAEEKEVVFRNGVVARSDFGT